MPYVYNPLIERSYEEIEIGDSAKISKTITETDEILFAGLLGSLHPLHVDEEFCKKTIFGKRVVHGMLTYAFIGPCIGGSMPGLNGVYASQEMRFVKPVFIGDTITVHAEVIEKVDAKQRLIIKTTITNQHGEVVLDGKAMTKVFEPVLK